MFKNLAAVFLALILPFMGWAQHTLGTEFWVGFLTQTKTDQVLSVHLSGPENTSGTISIPGSGYSENFNITAGVVTTINVTSVARTAESEVIENKGLKITAQKPINCFASNVALFITDASLVFPVSALGTEYLAMAYPGTGRPSEIVLVATQPSTRISVIPSVATQKNKPAGVPFSVTLEPGQVYQIKSKGEADLTGTRIVSEACKPIAVFSGAECTNVPVGVQSCDHLYEQMIPTHAWGKKFYTVPLATRLMGDLFRIMALEDNTKVTFNGTDPRFIDKAKYTDLLLTAPTLIEATAPVLVAQYSTGTLHDGNPATDPFMVILFPDEQGLQEITFNTIGGNNADHFVNVVIPSTAAGSMTMNGVPVGGSFLPFPGDASRSYAQLHTSAGNTPTNHTLKASANFNAIVYGYGVYESYGYAAGGSLKRLLKNSISWTEPLCVGTPVEFSVKLLSGRMPSFWNWEFGDGQTSAQDKPMHTYSDTGTYVVRVIIGDSGLCGNAWADTLKVSLKIGKGVLAKVGDPAAICPGDTTLLWASGGDQVKWEPALYVNDPLAAATKAYPPATTWFKAKVSDGSQVCGSSTDSVLITVKPLPEAGFTFTRSGFTVKFSGTGDKGVHTWSWDFGDRSTPSDQKDPGHTYVQADSFLVTLIVKNDCGTDTFRMRIWADSSGTDSGGSGHVGISPGQKSKQNGICRVYPNPVRHGTLTLQCHEHAWSGLKEPGGPVFLIDRLVRTVATIPMERSGTNFKLNLPPDLVPGWYYLKGTGWPEVGLLMVE